MDFLERNWQLLELKLKELGIEINDCVVERGRTATCVHVKPSEGGRIVFQGPKLKLRCRLY